MRTRDESGYFGPYDVTWRVQLPSPPPGHDPFSEHYNSLQSYSSFFEASSDLGKGNTRSTWNPFQHYVKKVAPSNPQFNFASAAFVGEYHPGGQYDLGIVADPSVGWVGVSGGFGPWDRPLGGLPEMFNANLRDDFVVPLVDETELYSRAFKALLPGIRPRLSLLNSLYELKDFKSLPRTLRRISELPKQANRTLRRILGGTADGYLQAQFNVMPLLSDIAGFRNALKQFRSDVSKLVLNEGKRSVSRIQYDLVGAQLPANKQEVSESQWRSQFGNTPDDLIGTCKAIRTTSYGSSLFKAQLEYQYTLPGWQRENAAILGLLDALGVNLNPSIIWNAIPWSFVVDWVVGISQYLDNFKRRNLEPVTVIHRWCWSTSYDRTVSVSKEIGLGGPKPSGSIPVSTVAETSYKRSTQSPDIYAAITSSGLSPKEISLGAAIIGSRH